MVAVSVLGIALTSLLYGQAQAIRAQARTQTVTLATIKAMETADQALMHRAELPMPGDSEEIEFEPPFDNFHGNVRVEQNELVPSVSEVTITVSWDEETAKKGANRSSADKGSGARKIEICFYVTALP